jgi:tetratricopeptide (TPR) repeat protein
MPSDEAERSALSEDSPAPAFVGRSAELGELDRGLTAILRGDGGRLFLISGEPGIGKTRLATEVGGRAAARGARVLWGRCWEGEGAPPFWPWAQVIRSCLGGGDAEGLTSLGADRKLIARLAPEFENQAAASGARHGRDSAEERFRLFEATASLLRMTSLDQPLLLVFDDLQWADPASLLLLRFVANDLARSRIAIIGTYRDVEARLSSDVGRSIGLLARHGSSLPLRGLSGAEVERFMAEIATATATPQVAARVHRATQGNPFFVGELVRLLAAEGQLERDGVPDAMASIPHAVREVIHRRLELISEACERTLTVASVFGRDFELVPLQRVSALPADDVLRALDEARHARMIAERVGNLGKFSFAHDLLYETLYDRLPSDRRMVLHREIGEALENLYADDIDAHLGELANHFCRAAPRGGIDRAVAYATRAAERASHQLAYEEAARYFERALDALDLGGPGDLQGHCRLLLSLAEARWHSGEFERSKDIFRQAAELAEDAHDADLLSRATLGLGWQYRFLDGRVDDALVRLLEGASRAFGGSPTALHARVLARQALAITFSPAESKRHDLAARAVEMARDADDSAALAQVLLSTHWATWTPDNVDARLATADEIGRLGEVIGDEGVVANARSWRIGHLLEIADAERLERELDIVTRAAGSGRRPYQRWHVTLNRSGRALFEGRFEQAEAFIRQGMPAPQPGEKKFFTLLSLFLAREQGRLAGFAERTRAEGGEMPTIPAWRCCEAWMDAELGRFVEAGRVLDDFAGERFAALPRDMYWFLGVWGLAEVASRLAHRRHAAALYKVILPYADRCMSAPVGLSAGSMARSLGVLAAIDHRFEEACHHFDQALDVHGRLGTRPWLAHTQHDYARALLARGQHEDRARLLLAEALRTAYELGMSSLIERIEKTGGPVENRRPIAIEPTASTGVEQPDEREALAAESVFRREGEYWSITFGGETLRLTDSKGLRYLALLLRSPGREFFATELVSLEADAEALGSDARGGQSVTAPSHGDAGEMLDARAKEEYRRRLDDLRSELEEARAFNDPGRTRAIEAEIDFVTQELARGFGLGERPRRAASSVERARLNVTRTVHRALERIAKKNRALNQHLANTVRTGTLCSYSPDPRIPIDWKS